MPELDPRRLLIGAAAALAAVVAWENRGRVADLLPAGDDPAPAVANETLPPDIVAAFAPVRTAAAAVPAEARRQRAALYRAMADLVPGADELTGLAEFAAVNAYAGKLAFTGAPPQPALNDALEVAFTAALGDRDVYPTDELRGRLTAALQAAANALDPV